VPSTELERLERENADLRSRVAAAEAAIDALRHEAIGRRAEVRRLAEQLPAAMSRRVVLRSMAADVAHHPDKIGAAKRLLHKLGRGPRKAVKVALQLVRQAR